MKITIPETFMGVKIEGAMERVLSKDSQKPQATTTPKPFEFKNPSITPHDYVQIPSLKKVISRFEFKDYNNMNWQDTHFKLHENGLYMPTIPEFMTHFMNVLESYKNKVPLFDAAGNPLTKDEIKDMYLHLTKDHIAIYGNNKGAWTWLDALFEQRDNGLHVLSEHRTQVDSNGNKTLVSKKAEKLETCLMEDCFVDLDLNTQKFPVKKSDKQKYNQGENIYYWYPRDGQVARFYANSDRASLDCNGGPSDRDSDLGVFGVMEGK